MQLQGHPFQEDINFNFTVSDKWAARISGSFTGGVDRGWHPQQAKPHWFYFACPDYMITNNSPLNIFPFLTTAVTAENEDGSTYETGEYTGNEDYSPPGGYKTKLVGKLQGAYKNYEDTVTTTVIVDGVPRTRVDAYSTAFHQEHMYGDVHTEDVGTTFFGMDLADNLHRYVVPRLSLIHI